MILVHVQKMYKIFRLLIEVPDYSSSFFPFFFQKMKRKLSSPDENKTKASTRMILVHVQKMYNKPFEEKSEHT